MSQPVLFDGSQPHLGPVYVLPVGLESGGSVFASTEPGRAVVWLSGDIDLALAADLAELTAHVRDLGRTWWWRYHGDVL